MITLIIVAITVGISVLTMNDNDLKNRYMFNPYAISRYKEWWRFLTYGFLHAHFAHLFFNMYALYIFGTFVEQMFKSEEYFGLAGGIAVYLLLYVGALILSSVYTYFREKENAYYNALGASGAVSAVVFTSILINPLGRMGLLFIPVMIPAWIFGTLFLVVSWVLARRNIGNVGHDAHFWGAIYGFILPLIFKPELFRDFIAYIKDYFMYGGNIFH
jgi:membrane associated rhomboid family serine protease